MLISADSLRDLPDLCHFSCRHHEQVLPLDLIRSLGLSFTRHVQFPGTFLVIPPGSISTRIYLGFAYLERARFASDSWECLVTEVYDTCTHDKE